MKHFEMPAVKVVAFAVEDVITTSGGLEEDELPGDLG